MVDFVMFTKLQMYSKDVHPYKSELVTFYGSLCQTYWVFPWEVKHRGESGGNEEN